MNIPVLHVQESCLALAYEQALLSLHTHGIPMATQYDKPGDPHSLDATMNITITEPLAEPMIHQAFPGGIEELREYVMELAGAKDHWVKNLNDPQDTRWEYTYHGRLAAYGVWHERHEDRSVETGERKVDQIQAVIDKLSSQPHSRQAQMITWMPTIDTICYDPPCLQSLWYRILIDKDNVWWLNCNVRFRSNDAWAASFMNMFGFIQFNREIIAAGIAERTGTEVRLGRMNWQADSYHIYGKDISAAQSQLFDRLESLSIEERTFNFSDPFIQQMYHEATEQVENKIQRYDAAHS